MANNGNVERIKGVFSTQEIKKIGTGTTTRRTVQKSFWFIENCPDGSLECQPLNSNYVPSGPKRRITLDELMEKYAPEPEFYMSSVFPKMMQMQKDLDEGDTHRQKGENFSAEMSYDEVLSVDEENIRANFGIGLTYLQRDEGEKAKNIFDRLLNLEATFSPEHKHLFNEFGISLRKTKMFAEAISYYTKALDLTKNDENLFLNVARLYFEMKDYSNCSEHLLQALELKKDHETGQKFLNFMLQKGLIPKNFEEKAKNALIT